MEGRGRRPCAGAGRTPASRAHTHRRTVMAMLPARRGGQNVTILDPSREFEDIYDRMGQLMNLAMGDFGPARPADVPWSPLGDVSETDDAYQIQVELPGVGNDQVDLQVQDREL